MTRSNVTDIFLKLFKVLKEEDRLFLREFTTSCSGDSGKDFSTLSAAKYNKKINEKINKTAALFLFFGAAYPIISDRRRGRQ
jgi:hypothetical protein